MQIRTQVIVGTGLSLMLALLLGVGLWEVERRTAREIERAETVSVTIRSAFDLTVLTAEFLDSRHVRAQHQWWASERRLSRALRRLSVSDRAEQDLVLGMDEALKRCSTLFAVMDGGGWEGPDAVNEALVHQSAGQIVIALRHLSSLAEQLDRLLRTRLMHLQQLSRRVGIGAGTLLALAALLVAVHTRRGLVRPMARLLQGMRDAGEGNLAPRVGTYRNDEIGELSRAFDHMTIRLQATMASREALQREVAVRQQEEAALTRHSEELERSNRDLEEFAYAASHDLQEPLRKIEAFGSLLAARFGDRLPEEGRDYLSRMQGAARRMRALIEDLLAFSRITTRARPFTAVDLRHTVDEVLCDLDAVVRDAGGRVTIGNLPQVHAEPVQMRQLLQNLIGNALKFRREGVAPVVQVYADTPSTAAPGGDGHTTCRLVIEDNGIGFDEKYHDRIFGLFQRLHGRSEYTGTGIGLALCRKIVDRHRGTIVAHSKPGQGTRFEVTLPLASSGDESQKEAA
jgi:signal transduction histidine kinase